MRRHARLGGASRATWMPLRYGLESGSVFDSCVSLLRRGPVKSPPLSASSSPSLRTKLLCPAQAWISVPSTLKCSPDNQSLFSPREVGLRTKPQRRGFSLDCVPTVVCPPAGTMTTLRRISAGRTPGRSLQMKFCLSCAFVALMLLGCTTTQSDVVLMKTEVKGASCTAEANAACASCSTTCPALKQALCVGGDSRAEVVGAPAACVKAASCACIAL